MKSSCFILLCLLLLNGCKAQVADIPQSQMLFNQTLQEVLDSLNLHPKQLNVHINKTTHTFSMFYDTLLLKTYPAVFGTNPTDDKLRQGDRCTPEGTFSIFSKYPHKDWHKFIWITYPTADSWTKHNTAKAKGSIPKDAKIGGEVGIHGTPPGYDYLIDEGRNWTWGCIALKNNDLDEVYPYITKESVIQIVKGSAN